MLLIPAIDLRNGQCVRLRQGRDDDVTVFSDDPVAMATRWVEAGAQRLHIVDLDGANTGHPANADVIGDIVRAHPDLSIQVGGGIRDEDAAQAYIEAGVDYIIIGTRAVKAPHFVSDLCLEFDGHIIVGLDARGGKVATDGWSKLSHSNVIDVAKRFEADGVAAIVFTDIERDGMMQGVNVSSTAHLAQEINIPVIASGGITNLDDIRGLCQHSSDGITGAIIGRALYEGEIDLGEAQTLVDSIKS